MKKIQDKRHNSNQLYTVNYEVRIQIEIKLDFDSLVQVWISVNSLKSPVPHTTWI